MPEKPITFGFSGPPAAPLWDQARHHSSPSRSTRFDIAGSLLEYIYIAYDLIDSDKNPPQLLPFGESAMNAASSLTISIPHACHGHNGNNWITAS